MSRWNRTTVMMVAVALVLMGGGCEAPDVASGDGATLIFAQGSEEVARKKIPEGPTEQVSVDDPYYEKTKTFRAVPLLPLLQEAFGMTSAELERQDFVLEAIDGYAAPVTGARLSEPGAYLAFQDMEYSPRWETIGPGQVDPAPLYLIWTEEHQRDTATYPRPWQLRRIIITSPESSRELSAPLGLDKGHEAWAGYELFQARCVQCHAINRSGGRVGPELNLPMNITEYREREQTLRFIQNAQAFRYSQMPAFDDLSQAQLDSLWSYLEAMRDRKKQPQAGPEDGSGEATEAM
ncbi:cytochrome c [Lujinxingia vulgaris]|uniref:Cytochrome c n=1 Tax=Lujinxingia vulgaris TaxID=2600176 RepID=A0A5C6X5K6_9DELT|nr:cytochrome c [Lujinxingia vulgaris]TXD34917.1 cytochrome c [Lujinxingia vulgaris]